MTNPPYTRFDYSSRGRGRGGGDGQKRSPESGAQ